MALLRLSQEWELGAPLDDGQGGFGQVFHATSGGVSAVVKLVPKVPGAERELLIPEGLVGVRNVIPVIDHGEHENFWALVMPKADMSLASYLDGLGRPTDSEETMRVLLDLADALAGIDGRVVHRDLKPSNVLRLDGRWCLADFGIARYADASTDVNTRKLAMTPRYAAPEQWRAEHATSATDVYAFGVIAFEMVMGTPPFEGSAPELRELHLHEVPPPADRLGSALATLVAQCLLKAPGSRPSPAELRRRLERCAQPEQPPGLQALVDANREEVERQAEEARIASVQRSVQDRRELEADAGASLFRLIVEATLEPIRLVATAADFAGSSDGPWSVVLNEGLIAIERPAAGSPPSGFPFDVVLVSEIKVLSSATRSGYRGRSHSLWYCDAQRPGQFQWFESAFMRSPLIAGSDDVTPFALTPGDAAVALGGVMGSVQAAWPFTPVVPDELEDFVSRWAQWFADAAQARLAHPSMMPERDPNGTWRRT